MLDSTAPKAHLHPVLHYLLLVDLVLLVIFALQEPAYRYSVQLVHTMT